MIHWQMNDWSRYQKNGADNRIFQRDPSCALAERCDYRLSLCDVTFRIAAIDA